MALINGGDPSGPGLTNKERKELIKSELNRSWIQYVENWDIYNAKKIREKIWLSREELSTWVEDRIQLALKYFYGHGDPDVIQWIEEETWITFNK